MATRTSVLYGRVLVLRFANAPSGHRRTSNQPGVKVRILQASTAVTLSGTFRDSGQSGLLEASNAISTENPATRDLYLFNSQARKEPDARD